MRETGNRGKGKDNREPVTVTLPADLREKLSAFCREFRVSPDLVVERALADYFREGDMSH